jgi:hypothetical protein
MQPSYYQFRISEVLADLQKIALVHTMPQKQNQCKQTITNSAFLNPWRSWKCSQFSIFAVLADLEKAALMPIDTTESKINASKLLPIQHFCSPSWSWECSLGEYDAIESNSIQASHYQFSISAALADLEKAALMPINIPESQNQCTKAITNSAFISSGWTWEGNLGLYDATESKSIQTSHCQFSISEALTNLEKAALIPKDTREVEGTKYYCTATTLSYCCNHASNHL